MRDDKPKRLSLSQIVEMLATRSADHSTIALAWDGKGDTKINVQVRSGENAEHATLAEASEAASRIYDELRERYPASESHDDAEVTLTRNAKGDTQITVELAATDTADSRTLEAAYERAATVYEAARGRFPAADGTVGK